MLLLAEVTLISSNGVSSEHTMNLILVIDQFYASNRGLWCNPRLGRPRGRGLCLLLAICPRLTAPQTALHKAALHGHLPIIQCLLQAKADVHARDADGWTALHNACSKVNLQWPLSVRR
jgi:hypothetical protein